MVSERVTEYLRPSHLPQTCIIVYLIPIAVVTESEPLSRHERDLSEGLARSQHEPNVETFPEGL